MRKGPLFTDEVVLKSIEGETIIVENVPEDPRAQYPEDAKEEGIFSVLAVPVILRDEVVGVMRVYTAKPRHFTEGDIYFLKAVANLGAIALANARMLEALKKDYHVLRLEIAEWRATYPLIAKGEALRYPLIFGRKRQSRRPAKKASGAGRKK
ncbi:GAF domain-containing protein [Chloroflexota bacterium]